MSADEAGTCSNCGAQLGIGAAWCGQCLTPVQQHQQGPQTGPAQTGSSRLPQKDVMPEYTYSRWKGDDNTFGPAGRIIMTVLLVIGLFAGYFLFTGGITNIGPFKFPVLGSIIVYAVIAIGVGAWALKTIWKRARVK
jgi:hypothetical protein